MLYTFKSSSAADVIMQRFSAEKILSVLGKTQGNTGVIPVSEMVEPIQKIVSELRRTVVVEQGGVITWLVSKT